MVSSSQGDNFGSWKFDCNGPNADALPKSSLGLEERLYSDEADRVADSVERPRYAGF